MLYSFIFFHTTIQVNDPEASLSNTINKKPCKNTTQAGTDHKILLNFVFLYKIPNIYYRILRTIGRYLLSSTRWLRPIVHIDLYKDEVKKISIKMMILFTGYLEFAVGFFSE